MFNNITERFNEVKGYKTKAGADRKAEAIRTLCDTLDKDCQISYVICQREWDDLWLPIAILNDKNEWCAGPLAHCGIAVTKA